MSVLGACRGTRCLGGFWVTRVGVRRGTRRLGGFRVTNGLCPAEAGRPTGHRRDIEFGAPCGRLVTRVGVRRGARCRRPRRLPRPGSAAVVGAQGGVSSRSPVASVVLRGRLRGRARLDPVDPRPHVICLAGSVTSAGRSGPAGTNCSEPIHALSARFSFRARAAASHIDVQLHVVLALRQFSVPRYWPRIPADGSTLDRELLPVDGHRRVPDEKLVMNMSKPPEKRPTSTVPFTLPAVPAQQHRLGAVQHQPLRHALVGELGVRDQRRSGRDRHRLIRRQAVDELLARLLLGRFHCPEYGMCCSAIGRPVTCQTVKYLP